jgi:hypothetical protein
MVSGCDAAVSAGIVVQVEVHASSVESGAFHIDKPSGKVHGG